MILYIVFLIQNITVACGSSGCLFYDANKVAVLIGAGTVELVIEIAGIIKVYRSKK